MLEKLGGRKFVGFLFITILLFVLVILDKLAVGDFTTFLTANFGIYVAGNSVAKMAIK